MTDQKPSEPTLEEVVFSLSTQEAARLVSYHSDKFWTVYPELRKRLVAKSTERPT